MIVRVRYRDPIIERRKNCIINVIQCENEIDGFQMKNLDR